MVCFHLYIFILAPKWWIKVKLIVFKRSFCHNRLQNITDDLCGSRKEDMVILDTMMCCFLTGKLWTFQLNNLKQASGCVF